MASTRQLKRRIKSVGNISQITKAMEMVSASKMRQAQQQALASRVYSRKLDEVLSQIAQTIDTSSHPLLQDCSSDKNEAILILSTDRGLTGSLNTNLFKTVSNFYQQTNPVVYTLGRLAKEFTIKSGLNLQADFGSVPDKISYESAVPIASLLMREFIKGTYSRVWIAYMDFVSTLSQVPRISQLLPLSKNVEESSVTSSVYKEYLFEPDPDTLLKAILPYSVELTIFQSLLEARASEHSARMVAMKNASENASELVGNLSLVYNRSRQANITSELLDIVTASATLA